jgi:hypothetical protein
MTTARIFAFSEPDNLFELFERLRAIGVTSDHHACATSLRFQLALAANSRRA